MSTPFDPNSTSKFTLPPSSSPSPPLPTTHLFHHLSSLPTLLNATNATNAATIYTYDLHLLPSLLPPITSLLYSLGSTPNPPILATLTLLPTGCIEEAAGWTFCGEGAGEHPPENETHHLRFVTLPALQSPKNPSLDNWLTTSIPNEPSFFPPDLAIRLSHHLQPPAPPPLPIYTPPSPSRPSLISQIFRHSSVRQQQLEESEWENGKRREIEEMRRRRIEAERCFMVVRPEEVTFRREGEMGIWENRSGMGVVVRVYTQWRRLA